MIFPHTARMPVDVHASLTLELNADSTEFCPLPGHLDLLAVGTYQLDEGSQRRDGRLHLYNVSDAASPRLLHTADVPGIFDLKWAGAQSRLIGAALADGSLRAYTLQVNVCME